MRDVTAPDSASKNRKREDAVTSGPTGAYVHVHCQDHLRFFFEQVELRIAVERVSNVNVISRI
jgi:hypothetical protein